MKTALIFSLIALSLAANAILLSNLRSPSSPTSGATAANVDTATAGARSSAVSAQAAANAAKVPGENWEALRGDGDLPALVARLRAAGYPASVVRAIVSAEISERFAARRKALNPTAEETAAFWNNRSPFSSAANPALMAARRDLNREQNKLFKDLLGPDAQGDQFEVSAYQKRQYGDLPRQKIDQIQEIMQDYSDLMAQVRTDAQGVMLSEDRQKLAYLEAEKRKDLTKLLTPEEFEEYQLRTSNTASQLRYSLSAFEPTEQEFRALFKLQEAYDDRFGQYGTTVRGTAESAQERQAAEKKLIADAKEFLGPERGAEYERSRDYSYQNVANLAKRLDLPKDTALTVYNLQKDTEQRANALRSDRTLAQDQRVQQLTTLAAEASAKVASALGDRGFAAYQENAGSWLKYIVPQPAPPATTTSPALSGTVIQTSSGGTVIIRQ